MPLCPVVPDHTLAMGGNTSEPSSVARGNLSSLFQTAEFVAFPTLVAASRRRCVSTFVPR